MEIQKRQTASLARRGFLRTLTLGAVGVAVGAHVVKEAAEKAVEAVEEKWVVSKARAEEATEHLLKASFIFTYTAAYTALGAWRAADGVTEATLGEPSP